MAIIKVEPSRWGTPQAQISPIIPHRLIWRSYGRQKCGRSRFALTAKPPIFVQSFDVGLEGTVEPFIIAGKDIRALEYPFNPLDYKTEDARAAAADVLWNQFLKDFADAINEMEALGVKGTIVWDTETEVWELLRFARFGSKSDRANSFEDLNREYRDLVRQAYGAEISLGLIQKTKEEWISKMDPAKGKMVPHNTGKQVPAGMKEIGYLVQANLYHSRVGNTFLTTVEDVRHDAAQHLVGETFENLDFPTLGQYIHPETSEEDWL